MILHLAHRSYKPAHRGASSVAAAAVPSIALFRLPQNLDSNVNLEKALLGDDRVPIRPPDPTALSFRMGEVV